MTLLMRPLMDSDGITSVYFRPCQHCESDGRRIATYGDATYTRGDDGSVLVSAEIRVRGLMNGDGLYLLSGSVHDRHMPDLKSADQELGRKFNPRTLVSIAGRASLQFRIGDKHHLSLLLERDNELILLDCQPITIRRAA